MFDEQLCEVEMYNNSGLITFYKSFSHRKFEIFKDMFLKLIDLLYSQYEGIVLDGNFNFDMASSQHKSTG